MTTAFLIVRRNVELKDVPLDHTIIGTTEVIGIAVTEAERDAALLTHAKSHALEMNRLGQPDRLDLMEEIGKDNPGMVLQALDKPEHSPIGLGLLSGPEFYVPKDEVLS